MNLRFLFNKSEQFLEDYAPTILTSIAVIGTITTGVLAAHGGYRAGVDICGGAPLNTRSKKAIAKNATIYFAPAVGVGVTTIGCVIFAHKISAGRVAAMAAAYSLSEGKFKEYRSKITEKLGLEEEKDIRQEIVHDQIRVQHAPNSIILGLEEVLCFDSHSGRYFKSSMESIRGAVNDTNFEVIHSNYATLQFFWDLLGLDATAYSEEFGWTADCPLEVQFSTMMSSDDKPCLCVTYDVDTVRRWNHFTR